MIAAVLEKLVSRGLLDDRTYAAAQARRMRARGASGRRISVRLHEKGVPAEIARSVLDDESHAREEADLAAARTYARRRRLGPHRLDPAEREARRQRDLATLARAGFGHSTAVEVIDASPEDARVDAPTP
jgi:regulatory protein